MENHHIKRNEGIILNECNARDNKGMAKKIVFN
jgi:hypothetical protein